MGDIITGREEVDDMSSLLAFADVYRDGTPGPPENSTALLPLP
jgi:hypothetical protein